MILDPKLVAQGWRDLYSEKRDERERLLGGWAHDVVWAATANDASYALEVIFAIHELDLSIKEISLFAAGPVEDVLVNQGAVVIDEIERKAKEDPTFAFVLGGVWQHNMPDAIWDRILACRETKGWDGIPK